MKNKILWIIANIAMLVFLFSLAAIESENKIIPIIAMFTSLLWLLVFSRVNKNIIKNS